jgi:hypothetical protein
MFFSYMTAPVVPSMTIMAGLDRVGILRSSSNAAGIESGPSAALAGAIESITARQVASILLSKDMS